MLFSNLSGNFFSERSIRLIIYSYMTSPEAVLVRRLHLFQKKYGMVAKEPDKDATLSGSSFLCQVENRQLEDLIATKRAERNNTA